MKDIFSRESHVRKVIVGAAIGFLVLLALGMDPLGRNTGQTQVAYLSREHSYGAHSVFESELLNLSFTVPEGHIMLTDEGLALMFAEVVVLRDDGLIDEERSLTVPKLMTYHPDDAFPMLVISLERFERLLPIWGDQDLSSDQRIALFIEVLEFGGLSEQGIEIIASVVSEDTLAGERYIIFSAYTYTRGMEQMQKYFFREIDEGLIVIMLSFLPGMEREVDVFLEAFTALNG